MLTSSELRTKVLCVTDFAAAEARIFLQQLLHNDALLCNDQVYHLLEVVTSIG